MNGMPTTPEHHSVRIYRFLFLNLAVFAGCTVLLWAYWNRLSDDSLKRIELGMPVTEVVAILGRPDSEEFDNASIGRYCVQTTRNGEPYTEFRDELRASNIWKQSIVIDIPNLFPCEDWRIGDCYFWEDGRRIFWITFDDDRIVKSKRVTTITRNKAVVDYLLAEKWQDIKKSLK